MTNDFSLFGRTEVSIRPAPEKMGRHQTSLWMGSCFADSFRPFLEACAYPALVNPLGIVYHPLVLGNLLFLSTEEILKQNFESQGVWLNYWLGSGFSAASESALAEQIVAAKAETDARFTNAGWLVMTWGTAHWYEHSERGMVGKCHKQPGQWFRKHRSSPEELTENWRDWILRWRQGNPGGKVLLTLSPVRHTRDGLPENAVSKAILRLAAEQLCSTMPGVFYFPSYELVLDELRDYRYFDSDLIHPGPAAVEWIWRKFSAAFFDKEEDLLNQSMLEFERLKRHRPGHAFGEEHEIWKKRIGEKSEQVRNWLETEREKQKK